MRERNIILQILLTIVFTPIFLFFIFFITLIVILPLIIYRTLIIILAKCYKSGELRKMISPISHIMGAEDMTGISSLTSFAAIELSTPVSVELISGFIEKNGVEAVDPETGALLYPELKECVKSWMGFLFWGRPTSKFDIKNHVYNLEDLKMNHSGDWEKEPNALQNCMLDLVRKKVWLKGEPFWEFIIISNIPKHLLGPDAAAKCVEPYGSIILFRMHHILGDGFCILKFLTRVFDFSNVLKNVAKPKFYANKEKAGTGSLQKLLGRIRFLFKIPLDILEELLRTYFNNPGIIPKMNDEAGQGSHLVGVISTDVPLSKIKAAKTIHGVDFTSVFLAMFAGGCQRFLTKLDPLSKLPQEVEIAFPLPMPGHPDTLTNHISQGGLRLPIAEPDGVKRLHQIQGRILSLKKSTLPTTTFWIMKILGMLPTFVSKWVRNSTADSVYGPSLIFSNLLGPAESVHLGEISVLGLRVGTNAPMDAPHGYCLMVISYNGNARLTVGAMSNYLASEKDAEDLLQSCLEELDALTMDQFV